MNTSRIISVAGMHCSGCENIIKDALNEIPGIAKVNADYPRARVVVQYDPERTDLNQIYQRIVAQGYSIIAPAAKQFKQSHFLRFSISFFSLAVIISLLYWPRKIWQGLSLPEIGAEAQAGLVFSVGLISGLHCIGMCGNFVLNYTLKDAQLGRSPYFSHALYGTGKTLAYAIFGALFGLLGGMFKITPFISGVTAAIAGIFLIVFGLNTLNVFSALKRVRIKQPEMMARFAISQRRKAKSPFFIGFFSGFLLGCGPLQAMYVLAAGIGDPAEGARLLTLFSLGTLPSLIGFGMMARLLSNTMTRRFIQVSGVILIVMGLMTLNKGLLRMDTGYDFQSLERTLLIQTGLDRYISVPQPKPQHAVHHNCH
jgi:uncharacterized protein